MRAGRPPEYNKGIVIQPLPDSKNCPPAPKGQRTRDALQGMYYLDADNKNRSGGKGHGKTGS